MLKIFAKSGLRFFTRAEKNFIIRRDKIYFALTWSIEIMFLYLVLSEILRQLTCGTSLLYT